MNPSKLSILFFAALLVVAGCTAQRDITEDWKGKNIDDATASLGTPSAHHPRTDGGTTYTWTKDDGCKTHLVTNSENLIVSGSKDACKLVDFSIGAGVVH